MGIFTSLNKFGGFLRCMQCGHEQKLGYVTPKIKHGWPKHCGYTMQWITKNELASPTSTEGAVK